MIHAQSLAYLIATFAICINLPSPANVFAPHLSASSLWNKSSSPSLSSLTRGSILEAITDSRSSFSSVDRCSLEWNGAILSVSIRKRQWWPTHHTGLRLAFTHFVFCTTVDPPPFLFLPFQSPPFPDEDPSSSVWQSTQFECTDTYRSPIIVGFHRT